MKPKLRMNEFIDHLPRIVIGVIIAYYGFYKIENREENKKKVIFLKIIGPILILSGLISLINGLN